MSANNKVWIDESPLASVVNVAGSPYQGSVSPNPPTTGVEYNPLVHGGSTYFPQSLTPKLTIPYQSALDLGTGDCTIEFWLNVPAQSGNAAIIGATNNGANDWRFYLSNNGVRFGNSAFTMILGQSNADEWTHFAIGKTGATIRAYRNGVQQSVRSPTSSDTLSSGGGISIGQFDIFSYIIGFIGAIRIVKGTNLYPNGTSFTPPFVMEAVSGSILVLNHYNIGIFDSACKTSFNLYGATRNETTYKYGNGSLQADSSGVYGENPAIDGFLKNSLGTGDWTVEGWINNPPIGDTRVRPLVSLGGRFGAGNLNLCTENSKLSLYLDGTRILLSSGLLTSGWNHFAATRQGSTYRIFISGNISGNTTYSGFNHTNKFFEIAGGGQYNGQNTQMDDIRITRSVARYIASFTPPATGLPKA